MVDDHMQQRQQQQQQQQQQPQHFGYNHFVPTPAVPIPAPTAAPTPAPAGRQRIVSKSRFPGVIQWLQALDNDEDRKEDGISFAQYGPAMKEKGFLRVNQLVDPLYVNPTRLQEWVGIPEGIGLLILQYANEDIETIRGGAA
jgi:hypothetical protein